MRRLAILAVVLSVLASPGAASAFGYKDTGFDPDDTPPPHGDVRSSTRKVWANAAGHRFLVITIRTFEPRGDDLWIFVVRLDSRGGRLTDHRMELLVDTSEWGFGGVCEMRPRKKHHWDSGSARFESDRVSCRIPLRWVHPTKRIRWKVVPDTGELGDYAPNGRGWFE